MMHFRWFFPPLHFSYSPKFQIQKDVLLASFCTCSAIRDYRWMSEIFNQIIHLWLMLPSCWCCPWLLCLTIRLFISLNQTNNLFLISQWTIFLYKIWSLFDLLTSNTQAALFFLLVWVIVDPNLTIPDTVIWKWIVFEWIIKK